MKPWKIYSRDAVPMSRILTILTLCGLPPLPTCATDLFVAIFIMLSMFLAILAEGQVALREEQAAGKPDPIWDANHKEFGAISYTADHFKAGLDWMFRSCIGDFFALRPSPGLKWKRLPTRPTMGCEIIEEKLATALQARSSIPYFAFSGLVEFTLAEFEALDVKELTADSFIKTADGIFFAPIRFEEAQKKPESAVMFEESLQPLAVLSPSKASEIFTISHSNGGSIPVDLSKLTAGDTISRDAQLLAALAALQGEVKALRTQVTNGQVHAEPARSEPTPKPPMQGSLSTRGSKATFKL